MEQSKIIDTLETYQGGKWKEREREKERGPRPLPFSNADSPWEGGAPPLVGCPLSPLWPIVAHSFPRGVPVTPRYSDKYSKHSETIPCPNTIVQYINLYLSTISRLLVMSVISSGTPNNLRSPKYITHNTNRHRTLSVRTLRVRELCRHDRDTSPVNNQQRNLDAHIGSYIFYEDLYRSNCNDNIRHSLCHRYVTCPRFDRWYLNT